MATKVLIVQEILELASDDWIYLAEIAWVVRCTGGITDPKEVVEVSLDVIRSLVEQRWVAVGDLERKGGGLCFVPWQASIDEVTTKIRSDWSNHTGLLGPGAVCWFSITDEGKKQVGD
jgi:hypothetical protein